MILVRGGISLTDGARGVSTGLSLITRIFGATYNNSNPTETWYAQPVNAADARGSFTCSRTGMKAPGRFKVMVGGKPYIKKYAPRNSAKESGGW